MALVSVNADFGRVASALERIADTLDQLVPAKVPYTPAKAEIVYSLTEEARWQKEQEMEKGGQGSPEGAESPQSNLELC